MFLSKLFTKVTNKWKQIFSPWFGSQTPFNEADIEYHDDPDKLNIYLLGPTGELHAVRTMPIRQPQLELFRQHGKLVDTYKLEAVVDNRVTYKQVQR